jgi:APA family basic amino acid/polyamine antiporter
VNIGGVAAAGRFQLATTVLKILPLIVVGIVGTIRLTPENFQIHEATTQSAGEHLLATVTLTLWAFLGLECATIPAGSVRDPQTTIPRATIIGTILASAVFILGTIGVMGVVPSGVLKDSTAPFGDAAARLFGDTGARLVSAGAAISCLGALNGWILMAGQLPLAVARDGLFPRVFMRTDRRGTPVFGLIVAGVLSTALVAMNYSRGLVKLFTFIILLSTLSTLVPYVFCSLAIFLRGDALRADPMRRGLAIIAGIAFVYAIGAIAGAGSDVVYWGFLLLLAGLPIYTLVARRRATKS